VTNGSEIEFASRRVLTSKYGRFGLAFPKPALISRGANPVFYVSKTTQVPTPFRELSSGNLRRPMDLATAFDIAAQRWGKFEFDMLMTITTQDLEASLSPLAFTLPKNEFSSRRLCRSAPRHQQRCRVRFAIG
jgi:hypothetical protein